MKTFALIGAAGYIAPKHLKAIKDVGGRLTAAMDINDSVGILDSYFPDCCFFVEMERFERFLRKNPVDYFVVCTPNYLHDSHIWTGLAHGAKVICEKPAVVSPWNLRPLFKQNVNFIQQLRLCEGVECFPKSGFSEIDILYCTPRGNWYDVSWKANEEKSGGLIYNIGIHFIDLLCWKYGRPVEIRVYEKTLYMVSGEFLFKRAKVSWSLSIRGKPIRLFSIDCRQVNVSDFSDLHTKSYEQILNGNGFKPEDVYTGIETAHKIKEMSCLSMKQAV